MRIHSKFPLGQRAGNYCSGSSPRGKLSGPCVIVMYHAATLYRISLRLPTRRDTAFSPMVSCYFPGSAGCAHFYLLFRRNARASLTLRISSSTFRIRILFRLSASPFRMMRDEDRRVFTKGYAGFLCLVAAKHCRGYKISILPFAFPSACQPRISHRGTSAAGMIGLENKTSAKKKRGTRQESRRILH